ncbi:MFS transporter [Niveibacterium sp. SC-1]|uniref:MFS transporter n=1 Tax=Niveibacterium sp. SC-1 TaxID=3135646 RepID=UPI003120320D
MSALKRLSTWYFVSFIYGGLFVPYFGLYLAKRGYPAAQIGVLMSLSQGMRVVAPNAWALLAERWGKSSRVVQLTALGAVLSFGLVFLDGGFWLAFIALALVGMFNTAGLPLVETLTLLHLGSRSASYGRIRLWGSLGFVLTVLAGGHLLERLGTEGLPWMAWAALLAGLAAAGLLVEPPVSPVPHAKQRAPFGEVLREPHIARFFLACLCVLVAHGVLNTFYSLRLVQAGYSKGWVGALWTVGVSAEIAAFLLVPRLLYRVSLDRVLKLAAGAAVLRFLAIAWLPQWPIVIVVAQLMHGLSFAAFHAAAMARLSQWFSTLQLARAQGIYGSVCFGGGGLLGGILGGLIWDAAGPAWAFTLSAAFAAAALALFASSAAIVSARGRSPAGENT